MKVGIIGLFIILKRTLLSSEYNSFVYYELAVLATFPTHTHTATVLSITFSYAAAANE